MRRLVEPHSPEHGAPPSAAWSTVKLQLLLPEQAITGAAEDTSASQTEPLSLAQLAGSPSVGKPNTCSHRYRHKRPRAGFTVHCSSSYAYRIDRLAWHACPGPRKQKAAAHG